MKFDKFFLLSCYLAVRLSQGLEIASKTNFEDLKSSETKESTFDEEIRKEPDSDSRESTETTKAIVRGHRDRAREKNVQKSNSKDLEAKIPVSIKESGEEFQLRIPVKVERKKEKPKHVVKFYKGTEAKTENRTSTSEKPQDFSPEPIVPVVKGGFIDVKPDFLVPIPRETVPRDISSVSPLNDFRNYFKHVAARLRAGRPEYIEGLRPPPPPSFSGNRPFLGNEDPYDRRNCSYSYSGSCHSETNGHPYPDVGGTESPYPPRPTYGVPGNNDWQRPVYHGNDLNSQRPGTWAQGNHDDWGGGGNAGHRPSYWNQERPAYPPGNQERPVYPPGNQANDDRHPWNPQVPSQGEWNRYQGRPNQGAGAGGGPVRLNGRRGTWISCKPFEIFAGREAGENPLMGCPSSRVPSAIDFSTATPTSKIDDKTFFGNENQTRPIVDEPTSRLVFPS